MTFYDAFIDELDKLGATRWKRKAHRDQLTREQKRRIFSKGSKKLKKQLAQKEREGVRPLASGVHGALTLKDRMTVHRAYTRPSSFGDAGPRLSIPRHKKEIREKMRKGIKRLKGPSGKLP